MDYHTHTKCSFDGEVGALELCRAAERRGVRELAVTDHFDIGAPEQEETPYNPAASLTQVLEAREQMDPEFTVLYGVELGQAHHDPEFARGTLTANDYDFVIGSLHSLRGHRDFYFLEYPDKETCAALIARYLEELLELSRHPGLFDVLGHLTYPLRYMSKEGRQLSFAPFRDRLEALFRNLLAAGRGIELNVSGLDGELRAPLPDLDTLKLYRSCGGELVTVGSDAHTPGTCGLRIAAGYDLLRQAGFRYVTAYRRRIPRQLPL